MTPITALWLSDSLKSLSDAVDCDMRSEGVGSSLFGSIRCDESVDNDSLAKELDDTFRKVIDLDAADTVFHLTAFVTLHEADAAERVSRIASVVKGLGHASTLEVFVLQDAICKAIGHQPESAASADIAGIRKVAAASGLRASVCVIDDYTSSGAPVGFTTGLLARLISAMLMLMIENYNRIFIPSLYTTGSSDVLAFGLAELRFDRAAIVEHLLHRAFVAALEAYGINVDKVDAQQAAERAGRSLEGIDHFHDDFYHEHVEPLVDRQMADSEIAASISGDLDKAVDALRNRLTGFMAERDLTLPEKEATLALILGRDNRLLSGTRYKGKVSLIDDALSSPASIYLDAFNQCAAGSGLLPCRGDYPALRFPDIEPSSPEGLPEEDPRNKEAFDPLNELKILKSDILDLTSYIRRKETELEDLRASNENERIANGRMTSEGFKFDIPRSNPDAEVVEQPLKETYCPSPGLKPASSVDLRGYFSAVRDQRELGSCSTFALTAMYEHVMNQLGTAGLGKAQMSERFLYYNSNVVTGRHAGGSNFYEQLEVLGKNGICQEELYPYTTDITKLDTPPSEAAIDDAHRHRVLLARQIPLASEGDKFKSLSENHRLLTSALSEGYPIGISLKIYDDFGSQPGGHIPRPTDAQVSSEEGGYHAMVIAGYSERDKCYIVRNSWGEGFGDNGYCYISAAYVDDPVFNRFCCIVAETTEGATTEGGTIKVPQLVAPFAGTETQLKMAAISNALDEARIRLLSLTDAYENRYKYYRDMIERLAQPHVRDDLRRAAENECSSRLSETGRDKSFLIDSFTTSLRDFCRKYLKTCCYAAGGAALLALVAGIMTHAGIDSGITATAWWLATAATAVTVILFINYKYQRRRKRRELQADIDEAAVKEGRLQRKLQEMQLRFHVAGMVMDAVMRLSLDMDKLYQRLTGYDNNLSCWLKEDSAKAADFSPGDRAMFITLTDPAAIDKFFMRHREEIAANIDLLEAFDGFDLTPDAISEVRLRLEDLSRKAISRMLERFNMADYIQGRESYEYVAPPDLGNIMKRLNRMAAVLTRHDDNDDTRETRHAIIDVAQERLAAWRRLISTHFSFPPVDLPTRDSDKLTVLTVRALDFGNIPE